MATVFELLKDPTIGLLPYLQAEHAQDFERFKIRPYGFQALGVLDPDRNSGGYELRGMRNFNLDPEGRPSAVPVLLGYIAPVAPPIEASREQIFALGHQILRSIGHWEKCIAVGLTNDKFDVTFDLSRDQSRNVASVRSQAWWWVLRWQFELEGFFDVPD